MSSHSNSGCCNTSCVDSTCCTIPRTTKVTQWCDVQVPVTKTQIIMVNKEVCCRDNRLHTIYDEREVTVCVPVICKELRTITKCVTENVEEEQEVTVCVPVMTREKRVAKINVCKTVTEEVEMEVCVPVTTYTEKEVCSRVQIPSACGDCGNCGSCASGCTYGTQITTIKVPCTTLERQVKKVPVCKQITEVVDKEYEVCVNTTKQEVRMVKTCKPVSRQVECQIEVSVCKMQTQTKIIRCPRQVYNCENVVKTIQVPERVTVTEYECRKRPVVYEVDCHGCQVPCSTPAQPSCGPSYGACNTPCGSGACVAGPCATSTSKRCQDTRAWSTSFSPPLPANCNSFPTQGCCGVPAAGGVPVAGRASCNYQCSLPTSRKCCAPPAWSGNHYYANAGCNTGCATTGCN